jgi:hypothetical protein
MLMKSLKDYPDLLELLKKLLTKKEEPLLFTHNMDLSLPAQPIWELV